MQFGHTRNAASTILLQFAMSLLEECNGVYEHAAARRQSD
jgi:hypothetical protein